MPWPGMTDFSEAVQNPAVCFKGTELQSGQVALNRRGLPLMFSGSFACVYSLSVGNQKFAVRCFTREIKDQQSRYEQLTNYLYGVLPPAFVDFEYLEHGINFRGDWYPIVKMEWVEGDSLSKFVDSNINEPAILRRIAAQWRGGTTANLRGLRIAHNDLQHGNVMVQRDGSIRLVDYDGMFLPHFRGQRSPELGHKNYQHPLRTSEDYDDYVDNFPTLVIYTSLLAIAAEPDVWSFFNDDNLIFTRDDYADPKSSQIFNRLNNSPDPAVVNLTKRLDECCSLPVKEVPDLETILLDLPPSPAPARAPAPSAPGASVPAASVPAASAPGTTAPAPGPTPATTAAPESAGGYRQILQAQQGGAAASTPAGPSPLGAAPPQARVTAPAGPGTGILCSRCNRPVEPSDRFCIGCGAPVRVPAAPPAPLPPAVPPPTPVAVPASVPAPPAAPLAAPPEPRRQFNKLLLSLAAIIIVGIIVVVVGRIDIPGIFGVGAPAAPSGATPPLPPNSVPPSAGAATSGAGAAALPLVIPTETPAPAPTNTPVPTPTLMPTLTPMPTSAPTPTPVPIPENASQVMALFDQGVITADQAAAMLRELGAKQTLEPTNTPEPTPTPTPAPTPTPTLAPTVTPPPSAGQISSGCRVKFDGLDVASSVSSGFTQPGYKWVAQWRYRGYEPAKGLIYHFEITQEGVRHVDVHPVLYSWVDEECHKQLMNSATAHAWAGHPSGEDDPAVLTFDIAAPYERWAHSWLCLWKDYGRPGNVLLSCTTAEQSPGS